MKIFFSKHKKKIIPLLSLIIVTVLFFYPHITLADGNAVSNVIGWILVPIIGLVSKLAILFLDILVGVAQYNNFINSSAVSYGWVVVRDLCNMFFVLILLIIAFASILRIESYNLKTWLPKLIIMAVLINFSKMICGVLIDFAQVIMLTFINAIKDIAGGNLTEMLGINKILVNSQNGGADDTTMSSVIGSLFLALIMVIIATVVILVMLITLVVRMVMLWIYIVLSPLAYLLASFPQGASYSQRWWSDFSKNLIIGPILAFFLWLSFASMGSIHSSNDIAAMKAQNSVDSESGQIATTSTNLAAAATEAGSKDNMILFIVSIGMLLGGLMISNEMGGIAGKVAGTAMAKLQSAGTGTLKFAKRATGIQRAQDAIKSYQKGREAKRGERAQSDGLVIAKGIGKAKKGAAFLPNQIGKFIGKGKKFIGDDVSQKAIDETRKGVEAERNQKLKLEELKVKMEKFDTTENDLDQTHLKTLNDINANTALSIAEKNDRTQKENDEYQQRKIYKDEEKNTLINEYREITGTNVATVSVNDINQKIQDKEDNIKQGGELLTKKMNKAKKVDEWSSVIGNIMTLGLKNKIKHAGEEDLDIASNYNSSEISKHKEKMKDDTEEELREKMNDRSKIFNPHERAAAAMVLMDQGKLTQEEAKIKKEEISNKFTGVFGKDNKVMNQLDGSLVGNYQDLTKIFTDLKKTLTPVFNETTEQKRDREAKHEATKNKIARGVVNGTIKIEDINDQDSLNLIMPKLAETITPVNFKSMVGRQTAGQKAKIELALKTVGADPSIENKGARIQLANLKKDLTPLNGYEKEEYFSNMNHEQMSDLLSNEKGRNSLKVFFQDTGRLDKLLGLPTNKEIGEELAKSLKNINFNNGVLSSSLLKSIKKVIES